MYTIDLAVQNEEELYNRFDRTHATLSGDVISYIHNQYERKAWNETAVIRICSENDVDTDSVNQAFQNQLQRELDSNRHELRVNRIRMWRLFLIGLAFVVAGIVLTVKLGSVALEVISIIGSMAIKDAATIWIEYNTELRLKGKKLEYMMRTEIEAVRQ